MTTTVARIYPSYGAALEASNALNGSGFHRDEIDVISKAVNTEDSQIKDLSTEIARAGIPAASVPDYAAAVDSGKSLLVVRAAWGSAKKALKVVGEGAETDVLNTDFYETTFDMPKMSMAESVSQFPFSAYFKIPLLLTEPAPFSKYWGLPTLLPDSWTFSSFFSWPLLTKGFTFGEPKLTSGFSLGEPKLVSNGAVFSDQLNLPVLSKKDTEK